MCSASKASLLLALAALACSPTPQADEVCAARLQLRFANPSPLERENEVADVARITIEQNGQIAFDQTSVTQIPEPGTVLPVADREGERPALAVAERFLVTARFYSSTSRRTLAVGTTPLFACLEPGDVDVPLYVGGANEVHPTSAIPGPRTGATAVPLGDGRVLVFGGEDALGDAAVPAAFLYEHGTGEHCADECLSALPAGRIEHSATRLEDGRVLIAGGRAAGATALADGGLLFDPETMTFSEMPALDLARRGHSATLLEGSNTSADVRGDVLVAGGEGDSGPLDTVLLVDVDDGSVQELSTRLSAARRDIAAAMMTSGRVALSGGRDAAGQPTGYLDFFDSELKVVEQRGEPCVDNSSGEAMCARRAGHTATVLSDDNVLLAGGELAAIHVEAGAPPSAEVLLLASESSLRATASVDALEGRVGHAAVALPCVDGTCPVLFAGGVSTTTGEAVAPALFYPSTSPTPEDASYYQGGASAFMTFAADAARIGAAAALLEDGTVYIVGGLEPDASAAKPNAALFSRCVEVEPLTCPAP